MTPVSPVIVLPGIDRLRGEGRVASPQGRSFISEIGDEK